MKFGSINADVKLDQCKDLHNPINITEKILDEVICEFGVTSLSNRLYGQLYAISAVLRGALKQMF